MKKLLECFSKNFDIPQTFTLKIQNPSKWVQNPNLATLNNKCTKSYLNFIKKNITDFSGSSYILDFFFL